VITNDEVDDFFKFRDSTETDNSFQKVDDYYTWLKNNVAIFRHSDTEIATYKQSLEQKQIHLITDESLFKITVQAQVNQAVKTFEVWVSLGTDAQTGPSASPSVAARPPVPAVPGASPTPASTTPDSGLRITFMRIL
jgi:hypothetical protein